jgi:hypothetical protein
MYPWCRMFVQIGVLVGFLVGLNFETARLLVLLVLLRISAIVWILNKPGLLSKHENNMDIIYLFTYMVLILFTVMISRILIKESSTKSLTYLVSKRTRIYRPLYFGTSNIWIKYTTARNFCRRTLVIPDIIHNKLWETFHNNVTILLLVLLQYHTNLACRVS